MIGILPRYNVMKCQVQSMSGTSLGTYHKMLATNKYQVSCLEILGSYPTAGLHETVKYLNVICMTCSRYGQQA